MMQEFSPPVRRFAALSFLAIALLLLWQIIVDPISDFWAKASGDHARSARLIEAYQRNIAEQPQWQELQQQMQQGKYANLFVEGGNIDLASAKLQEEIKRTTEKSGAQIHSIQVMPVAKQNGLQKLTVRVNFSVPVERLAGLLQKYDQAHPYLSVDNISIASPEGDLNGSAKPVHLIVNCDLSAYLSPEAL